MNDVPPSEDPPDPIDDFYRRASSLDTSRPSEAVRRAVLDHAERLAAERLAAERLPDTGALEKPGVAEFDVARARRPHPGRDLSASWRRPAIVGGLAAAVLAGLLITPHLLDSGLPAPTVSAVPEHDLSAPTAGAAAPAKHALAPAPNAPLAGLQALGHAEQRSGTAKRSGTAERSSAADRSGAAAPVPLRALNAASRRDPRLLRQAAAAGDVTRVRELLALPVDIEARDAQGRTALFLAAQQGRTDMVQLLLAHGADANAADAAGLTPLGAALAGGYAEVASALRRAAAQR